MKNKEEKVMLNKTMQSLKAKKNSKKGFTLMEMLIVVAIIAILIAIAIPVFSSQLSTAKTRVNEANARSAKSMAYAQYLLDEKTTAATYYVVRDTDDNMKVSTGATAPTTGVEYYTVNVAAQADGGTVTVTGPTEINRNKVTS
jgi:prepilin-type N-terminal cleavage/methylation domain-containing protein